MSSVLQQSAAKIIESECHSSFIAEKLKDAGDLHIDKENLDKLVNLFQHKIKFSNPEKFNTTYYNLVVKNSKSYFPDLDYRLSRLIFIKASTILLAMSKGKNEIMLEESPRSISDRELAGLQYIGGYIIHKLHKKFKNSKNWQSTESQQSINILLVCKTSVPCENQKLNAALSRGGLWFISADLQKILVVTEKYLSLKITKSQLRNIDTLKIVTELMKFKHLKDIYSEIIIKSEISLSKQVEKDLLYAIINLYVTVRCHSTARDYVQKHRMKKSKSNSKAKALRTELKRKALYINKH